MRHLLLISLFLLTLGCTPAGDDEATENGADTGDTGDDVVATVNGEPVTATQLEMYAARRGAPESPDQRRGLVDDLISIELLVQAARRDGVHERPDIAAQIRMQRDALLAQTVIRERIDADPITEEELQAEYEKYMDEGVSEELHARHILVEEEALARRLIQQLDDGADFAELAAEYSIDGSAEQGGDLGWFDPEMMVAPFARAAGELEPGTYTPEPVETRFGWHVIRLEDRRSGEPASFEEMRGELENFLQSERIESWVNELRESAEIEIQE